jgi:lipoprotein-releasing system ATP-binding protein
VRVRAEGLVKRFPAPGAPLVILDGLSLDLEPGEALAVMGSSGCGKSTLLHILGTLDEPSGGRVELDGKDPFAFAPRELARFRNRRIGFVFQDHYLLPQCSVLENVLIPTLVASSSEQNGAEPWARELIDRVGLGGRLHHRPSELSGGERQRAAIARALVHRPGLLLCDEPTGNLDSDTAERIGDLFVRLHQELEATLIAVTHSRELAARFRRRARLRAGRLVEES